jgi:hypothetical protein
MRARRWADLVEELYRLIDRHQLAAAEACAECQELIALQQQQQACKLLVQLLILEGQETKCSRVNK